MCIPDAALGALAAARRALVVASKVVVGVIAAASPLWWTLLALGVPHGAPWAVTLWSILAAVGTGVLLGLAVIGLIHYCAPGGVLDQRLAERNTKAWGRASLREEGLP
jgi:uncharacterized membrane protein YeiB